MNRIIIAVAVIGLSGSLTMAAKGKITCSVEAMAGKEMPASRHTADRRVANKGLNPRMTVQSRPAINPDNGANSVIRRLADGTNLQGNVVFANNWTSTNYPIGYYVIKPTGVGAALNELDFDYSYGSVYTGTGKFYGVYSETVDGVPYVMVETYDTHGSTTASGWSLTASEMASIGLLSTAAAYDPVTGMIYGCYFNDYGNGVVWGSCDYDNLVRTAIAPLDIRLYGVGVDKNGQFYGVGDDGGFYKIDKNSGKLTLVANTEFYTRYLVGGVVNDSEGKFLQTYSTDTSGGLVEFDLATGHMTTLCEFDHEQEVVGLYIEKGTAPDIKGIPAAPDNVSLTWEDGIAELKWNPVTESANGGDIDPNKITYTVYSEAGEILASGLKETKFTQDVPSPTEGAKSLFYYVAAFHEGIESKATPSNTVFLGAYTAPCTIDFDYGSLGAHTIIDANGDGVTWQLEPYDCYYSPGLTPTKADDWMISPPIHLDKNSTYEFSVNCGNISRSASEALEIFYGEAPTAEAMTNVLVPMTELNTGKDVTLTGIIRPTTTGNCFIGFHCISGYASYWLYIVDYSVSAPIANTAPDAIEDVKIVPDINGELSAIITFKVPETTLGGDPLNEDVYVEVNRYYDEIYSGTFKPGETVTFETEVYIDGKSRYSFIPSTKSGGEGPTTVFEKYIGVDKPEFPAKAVGWQSGNEDKVEIVWLPVNVNVHGNEINPDDVTYNIYNIDNGYLGSKINSEPINDTSVVLGLGKISKQSYLQYGISALWKGEESSVIPTSLICYGPAYEIPVVVSSGNDIDKYLIHTDNENGGQVNVFADSELVVSQDNDTEGWAFVFEALDQKATLVTGRILVAGEEPKLKFFAYRQDIADNNTITASLDINGIRHTLGTTRIDDLPVGEWSLVEYDLKDYKSDIAEFRLTGDCLGRRYTFFDNVQIIDGKQGGIESVKVGDNVSVKGVDGAILIIAPDNAQWTVYSIDGRMIESGRGSRAVTASSGLFVVKFPSEAVKVIVK